jgi:hypothetical protein
MKKINPLPTKERLHELFTYSFVEGALYWKHYPKLAGCKDWYNERWRVKLNNVLYQRQRLIWAYFYSDPGIFIVDHINRVTDDDRIENLRLATKPKNNCNSSMYSNNTSGFKGVTATRNKWKAQISSGGQKIHLGVYPTKEEAAAAYAEAANRIHGEFVGHLQ